MERSEQSTASRSRSALAQLKIEPLHTSPSDEWLDVLVCVVRCEDETQVVIETGGSTWRLAMAPGVAAYLSAQLAVAAGVTFG